MRDVAQGNTTTALTNLRPLKGWLRTMANIKPSSVETPTTTIVHISVLRRIWINVGLSRMVLKLSRPLKPFTMPALLILDMESRKTVTMGITIITHMSTMLGSIHKYGSVRLSRDRFFILPLLSFCPIALKAGALSPARRRAAGSGKRKGLGACPAPLIALIFLRFGVTSRPLPEAHPERSAHLRPGRRAVRRR